MGKARRFLSNNPDFFEKLRGLALGLLIALVGLAIPRNRKLWVVSSWLGCRFADNGKWFFIESAQDPNMRVIFSTRSREVYLQLRERGYPAVLANTIRGIWTALRAGVYVHDTYPQDVNFWAIRGALWVQLWHGIPLKHIERDISDPGHWIGKILRSLDAGKLRSRLRAMVFTPWWLKKEDLFCCTSEALVPIFAKAFGLPESRVRVTGYARNDAMWLPSEQPLDALDSPGLAAVDSAVLAGRRILLYVPTFRDDSSPERHSVFEHAWTPKQQAELHDLLQRLNAVMLIKLHPHIAEQWKVAESETIRLLPSALDVYPILNRVDVLITDYSSISFDYLLLERPVIFYCYDLAEYQSARGFYFDYELVTPGPKAQTFAELLTAIEATLSGSSEFSEEIVRVKNMFHKFSDAGSSSRIASEIRKELAVR